MTKYKIKNLKTGELLTDTQFIFDTMTGAEGGIIHIEEICDFFGEPCPPLEVVQVQLTNEK